MDPSRVIFVSVSTSNARIYVVLTIRIGLTAYEKTLEDKTLLNNLVQTTTRLRHNDADVKNNG